MVLDSSCPSEGAQTGPLAFFEGVPPSAQDPRKETSYAITVVRPDPPGCAFSPKPTCMRLPMVDSLRSTVACVAMLLLALQFVAPPCSRAQTQVDTSQSAPENTETRVTLGGWVENHRLLVLDQRHNRGERFYDRGIFRHVMPRKDREYALDMMAQRFSWDEFGYQSVAANSMHVRAGSVRRDLFAFVSRLQSTVEVASGHTISIDGIFQQDAEALRPFLELGYGWQFASHHTAGVRHTFSEYKPDLDVTAFYRFHRPVLGQVEVAVTLQNLYSDFIDQQLSILPQFRDVIRSYAQRPYLLSVSYTSPDRWPVRGEIVGAVQPISQANYTSQTRSGFQYQDEQRLHYVAALLEYHRAPFSGGLFYKGDASWLRRRGLGNQISSRYTTEQRFWRAGLFLEHQWGAVEGSLRGFTGSYRDEQYGRDFSRSIIAQNLDYEEQQWGLRTRLRYRWEPGPFAGLGYDALRRTYANEYALNKVRNPVAFTPWANQWKGAGSPGPSNHRLVVLGGHRFSHGKIEVGFGIDLDGDDQHPAKLSAKRFDNGFGRLILTW